MRLQLACILVLLPLTVQAETLGDRSTNEIDPNSVVRSDTEHADNPDNVLNESSPYGNPYSPSSATNFEALVTPSQYDQGRLSANPHEPEWLNDPFGRYGSLYSPGSLSDRQGFGSSYALGSPMNFHNRDSRIAGR